MSKTIVTESSINHQSVCGHSTTSEGMPLKPGIIVKVMAEHEINLTNEVLKDFIANEIASDSLANLLNIMGETQRMTSCYAADDLNEKGVEFIDAMYYFIHDKEEGIKK